MYGSAVLPICQGGNGSAIRGRTTRSPSWNEVAGARVGVEGGVLPPRRPRVTVEDDQAVAVDSSISMVYPVGHRNSPEITRSNLEHSSSDMRATCRWLVRPLDRGYRDSANI